MKKILALVAAGALVAALAVTGCGGKKASNDYGLIKDGTLTVATEATYPPFDSLDENGNVIGFDIVEISPPLDDSLASMFMGRMMLTNAWGEWADKAGKLVR